MTGEPSAGSRRRQHDPVQNVAFQRCARCARASPSIHAMPPSSKQPAPAPARAGPRRKAKAGSEASESTRLTVLAAALREFADKGLAGARVDEIAQQAGVNQQAIYYHFGSKDELFRATLEHGYSRIARANQALADSVADLAPLEAMTALIRKFFDRIATNRDMVAIILDENRYGGVHLTNGALIRTATQPLLDAASKILGEGAARGEFAADLDIEQFYMDLVSQCMFYFSNAFTLSALLGKTLASSANQRRREDHLVEMLLRSLRP